MAERLAVNQQVLGSSPGRGALGRSYAISVKDGRPALALGCPKFWREQGASIDPSLSKHGRVGESGRPRHPVKVKIAGSNPVTTAQQELSLALEGRAW